MKKFFLVKGKETVMVGDPDRPGRFAGQQLKDGSSAPRLCDNYEPCWTVHGYGYDIKKPVGKGQFASVLEVQAENMGEALKQIPQPKKADSK